MWNSKTQGCETFMIRLEDPSIEYVVVVFERCVCENIVHVTQEKSNIHTLEHKHRYTRGENINTPSSILRGKFERLALPLNFRQMHLCDIPYLRDGNAGDSNDSSKVDKRKQEVTSRWRLVLQSDFQWCSFSTDSSIASSRSQDKSIAQGVPANSVLLRSFEELRGNDFLERSILRGGRRQCGSNIKDSIKWRRGIEWVYRRLCYAWKTRTDKSVFLHYVRKKDKKDEKEGENVNVKNHGFKRYRGTVNSLFKPEKGKPGEFPNLYIENNLLTFVSAKQDDGIVHILSIEEDFTLYRNEHEKAPLYRHAVQVLERYATWPLTLEFAIPPSRMNSHKVRSVRARSVRI